MTMSRSRIVTALVVALLVAGFGLAGASEASAKVGGRNGPISFTSFDNQGTPFTQVLSSAGAQPVALPIAVPNGNARWSPDGSQLVMFTFTDLGLRPAISSSDGSNVRILPVSGLPSYLDIGPCVWTPSGTRMLCRASDFSGTDSSLDGIYSIRTDGTDPVRLTVNPYPPSGAFGGGDVPGDVSPDGHWFVFMRARPDQPQSRGREQSGALFVENIDGSSLRQITAYGLPNSHDETSLSWSPDGSRILFGSSQGALFSVQPDGSGLARVPLHAVAAQSFAAAPSWSPDGHQIAFKLCLSSTGGCDIYTVGAVGGNVSRLTTIGSVEFPDWGPAPTP